jgi:hypothetical protein
MIVACRDSRLPTPADGQLVDDALDAFVCAREADSFGARFGVRHVTVESDDAVLRIDVTSPGSSRRRAVSSSQS